MTALHTVHRRIAVTTRVLVLLTITLAIFALLGIQTSVFSDSDLGMAVRTVAHVPLFALIGYLWFKLVSHTRIPEPLLLLSLVLVAALVEIIEAQVYLGFSMADLTRNLAGVVLGYGAWKYVSDTDAGRRRTLVYLLPSTLLIAAMLAPVAAAAYKTIERQRWHPVIFDPRMSAARDMISPLWDSDDVSVEWRTRSLEVIFHAGRLPGLTLTGFSGDWTGYSTLLIDVESLNRADFNLEMHLRDREGTAAWTDRFNYARNLRPLERAEIRIPLAEIAHAPETRRMDLHEMAVIHLFTDAGRSQSFAIHSIALE